jgi:hypothetical protein
MGELRVFPGQIEQIARAYRRMATEGRYRPKAPSDGFGNITVPAEELDLAFESEGYAIDWAIEEGTESYHIGVPCMSTREAMVYTVEAARLLAGGQLFLGEAVRLLELAVSSIEETGRRGA